MTRWLKYELIALDEAGYVPLANIGAEFLFQVISERAERAAIIVTTNRFSKCRRAPCVAPISGGLPRNVRGCLETRDVEI